MVRAADVLLPVLESESGSESAIEWNPEGVGFQVVIGDDGFGELGLDGLGVSHVANGRAAGADAEAEWLITIDKDGVRPVDRVAMEGLGVDLDFVHAVRRDARFKLHQVPVGPFRFVIQRMVVEDQVSQVERLLMRAIEFLLDDKSAVERPFLRRHGREMLERFLDALIRRIEVLLEQMA